jgi:DNA-binding IclR family transcriptional regulator
MHYRRKVMKLHAAGNSLGRIAKQLRLTKMTVHRIVAGGLVCRDPGCCWYRLQAGAGSWIDADTRFMI